MSPLRRGIACVLFLTLLAPRAEAAVESYGLVFVIDGARGDALWDYARNGHQGRAILPNIKKYFIDQGVWVKKATSVFPTITGAAMPALLTGCTSERHGLPSLYFFDRKTKKYPVLYVLAEAFDFDSWLSPKVKTIWEYFEGPNDAISFGPAVHRGSDAHISILYNLRYKPLEIRGKMRVVWREIKRKLIGGLPAHLTVVYNGWFDHKEHANRVRGEAQIPEYEAVDGQVGEAVSLFLEMLEERRRAGVSVRYFMALAGDHGQQDINEFYSIDTFVRERQGAKVVDKIWTQVFGQKIKGNIPRDLSGFDLVVAAGEGHALLYFPTMTGSGREPTDKNWDQRPSLEMLRSYPYHGRQVDLPAMAAAERAVSFATAMDPANDTVHIYGAKGESTIERRSRGGLFEYRYRVVSGVDPWEYAGREQTRSLMDEAFHSSREWQLASLPTDYPDAVVQVYHAFGERERSPDLYLSSGPFISIGDLVDEAKSKSKHGGLTLDETWTTLAFAGTDLRPGIVETARTLDMVPTMLALMGKDFDPDSVDGEPIPEIIAQLQEARVQQLLPGELPAVQRTITETAAALQAASGEEIYVWARGLQSLLKRPGLPASWVRDLRRRSFTALAGREDPSVQALLNGENADEFLARRRPDLPRLALNPGRPADEKVVEGYLRDLADVTLRKVFDLLEVQFALANDPFGEKGREALAEVDRLLAIPATLHRCGFRVLVPAFSFTARRNGPNLRYEGLRGGFGVDAASRRALSEFVRIEAARSSGLRSLVFDRNRALLQVAIGERLAKLVRTLDTPRGAAAIDLEALAAPHPPGEVHELLLDLSAYGRIAALAGVKSEAATSPNIP